MIDSTCVGMPTMVGSDDSFDATVSTMGPLNAAEDAPSGRALELEALLEPLRRRQTSLTPWNRESWKRFMAATQAASLR